MVALPAQAQETKQYGGVTYPTAGWSPASFETYSALNAPDHLGRYLVFPSEATSAPLADWLDETAERFYDAEWFQAESKETADFPAVQGLPTAVWMMSARPKSGGRSRIVIWVGVRTGGRNYAVGLEGSEDNLMGKVGGFTQWLDALRFEGDGTAGLAPTPGPLHGVYSGLRLVYGLQPYYDLGFYTFSRDGWVYDGAPLDASADRFDFRAAAASAPRETGTYRVEGREIVLTFADGDQERLSFEPTADGGFEIDRSNFYLRAPPADGAVLDGRYRYGSYSTADNTASGGPLVASSFERDYAFTRDGRFQTSAALFASASATGYATSASGGEGTVTGRYAVRDGALVLTADDGTVSRKGVVQLDNGLVIAGEVYYKR